MRGKGTYRGEECGRGESRVGTAKKGFSDPRGGKDLK